MKGSLTKYDAWGTVAWRVELKKEIRNVGGGSLLWKFLTYELRKSLLMSRYVHTEYGTAVISLPFTLGFRLISLTCKVFATVLVTVLINV